MSESKGGSSEEYPPPVWGSTEFLPGDGTGLVARSTIGLVAAGHRATRDRLWELISDDAPLDQILDELSSAGLKSLPAFGIAQVDGDEVRIVARGATTIHVWLMDGSDRLIDPSTVRTWIEEAFASVARISISLSSGDGESDSVFFAGGDSPNDQYFVLAGSVPAQSLLRRFDTADSHAADAETGWSPGHVAPLTDIDQAAGTVGAEGVAEGQLAPDATRARGADGLETPTSETDQNQTDADPVADPGPGIEGATSSAESADDEGGDHSGLEPIDAAVEPNEDSAAQPSGATPVDSNETISGVDFNSLDDAAGDSSPISDNESLESSDSGQAAGDAAGGDYDFIYGHTVARSVEGAAVRVDESDDDTGGLISAVPPGGAQAPSASSSASASAPVPTDLPGDHDGLTISRADLAALRGAPASSPSISPGNNEVLAILCESQHPNPPQAPTCRVCGRPLNTAAPVSVPRPPLGVLVFSNGERVVVDRSVLIGRNPRVGGTLTGELPRIVKFDSAGQGLSRTHAEVRIEGWQMLLEDLQSTNGTEVTLPGQAPRRLHAGEPVVLIAGASVDFGEELQCDVEVIS